MELNIIRENGFIKISIIGAVDNENADELKHEFQALLEEDFQVAIFDLSFVPFITSSGIGKILVFYKNMISKGRQIRIKGINDKLLHLFTSIKLDQLFPIEK